MRLYHHPLSSNARRATLVAAHLGSDVELVLVDLSKGEHKRPEYLRKNPTGRVPTLEGDGFTLWESNAIIQYLAETTPGQTLYPADAGARADVSRWLFWSAAHFMPGIGILNWEHFVKGILKLGGPDPALVAKGEALVKENAAVLDAHLAERVWVTQGKVTLADFSLAAPLMSIESAKLPLDGYKNLLAWFRRVEALDAWKKTDPAAFAAKGSSSARGGNATGAKPAHA